VIVLDVRELSGYARFRSAILEAKAEAAAVILWKFHATGAPASGSWRHGDTTQPVELLWSEPTPDMHAAHGNELDATEDGAYAIAMAVADQLGFQVVTRLHHESGADWVVAPKGGPRNDYYKLEVSGMARVGAEKPETRLRAKVVQAMAGDYDRPGFAVVARFEDALILSEGWR
jgi:hypothetical protein